MPAVTSRGWVQAGWQVDPASFEQVVMAYLQRSSQQPAADAALAVTR